MQFERTADLELVRSIMTHPRVWPHIGDDFSGPRSHFQPSDHPAIRYVLVKDEGELLGLWMFVPENGVTYQVHTCLLPHSWGQRGRLAAREMANWMWRNSPCCRIVTQVPAYNTLAFRFAKAAGMTEYGRNPKSFLKHGVLQDTILLGISRPE